MNKNRLPDFIIIGAPNSGSTSLWHAFRQHPNIFMPDNKEPAFFTWDNCSEKLDWYYSLFEPATSSQKTGEASVHYCQTNIWPETAQRIQSYIPEVKLLYIVRHPLRRLESCWRQALHTGHWKKKHYVDSKMPLDFNRAVLEYPHFLPVCKYWQHLNVYLNYFPDEQIMVLFLEDFKCDTAGVLNKCFDFLGVGTDMLKSNGTKPQNIGGKKTMENPLYESFKSIRLFQLYGKFVPRFLRNAVYSTIGTQKVPSRIRWNEKTILTVKRELQDDMDAFLDYADKPRTFWNLDQYNLA
jgi:hypothetical protein